MGEFEKINNLDRVFCFRSSQSIKFKYNFNFFLYFLQKDCRKAVTLKLIELGKRLSSHLPLSLSKAGLNLKHQEKAHLRRGARKLTGEERKVILAEFLTLS